MQFETHLFYKNFLYVNTERAKNYHSPHTTIMVLITVQF